MGSIDPRRLLSTSNPLLVGRDVRFASPRGRSDSTSERWANLTDENILALVSENLPIPVGVVHGATPPAAYGKKLLVSTDPIYDPNSAKSKEYRGNIMVGPDPDGQRAFFVVFTHGPKNAPNSQAKKCSDPMRSLDAAIDMVNRQIDAKLAGKGSSSQYTPKPSSSMVLLNRTYVEEALTAMRDA